MLYVLTEQAVFWLGVKVVCCLAKEPGEEVERSPSPTPTKASFVSSNGHRRVNKNSKDELKIYYVEFEISRDDWRNAASEYRMQNWFLCPK